jgi:hypothetical protein
MLFIPGTCQVSMDVRIKISRIEDLKQNEPHCEMVTMKMWGQESMLPVSLTE